MLPLYGRSRRLAMQALQALKNYANKLMVTEEEMALANADAVFEFACRFILMRSLPGWSEEIYAEHLQSAHPLSTEKPGDPANQNSMFEDLVKEAEEIARAETVRLSSSGKPQLAERAV
jgi:hypothetical protein